MKNWELDLEQAVGVASVQTASRLLALDHGPLDSGGDYYDDDEVSYLKDRREKAEDEQSSDADSWEWRHIYAVIGIEPKGRVLETTRAIQRAMCRSIDQKELKAVFVRRDLSGFIQPEETVVSTANIETWTESFGIESGDQWREYCDLENDLTSSLFATYDQWREFQRDGLNPNQPRNSEAAPTASDVGTFRGLYDRIHELEARLSERPTNFSRFRRDLRSVDPLLAILLVEHFGDGLTKPYKVASVIRAAGERLAIELSDETIAARIKEVLTRIRADRDLRSKFGLQ